MHRIGVIKIKESFNISERGIVVFGYILEGMPKIGAILMLSIDNKVTVAKISGIEHGKIDEEGSLPFGLLLTFKEEFARKFLKENKIHEQIVNIDFDS